MHLSLPKLQIVTIGYVVDFDSFDYSDKLRLIQILNAENTGATMHIHEQFSG